MFAEDSLSRYLSSAIPVLALSIAAQLDRLFALVYLTPPLSVFLFKLACKQSSATAIRWHDGDSTVPG